MPGDNSSGKPGKPYIVKVSLLGFFAPKSEEITREETVTKSVHSTHYRNAPDDISAKGEVFVDHWENPINITLGDDRLPIGLWKSIEHMRKGETSRVMIKPSYGYNNDKNKDVVFFPRGWDTEEKKEILRKRRVFFEIKLHEYTIRHDILGDGLLVKTLYTKGKGFDRPSYKDKLKLNLKIYQKH